MHLLSQATSLESRNAVLQEQLANETEDKRATQTKLDEALAELSKTKELLAATQRSTEDLTKENGVLRQQADASDDALRQFEHKLKAMIAAKEAADTREASAQQQLLDALGKLGKLEKILAERDGSSASSLGQMAGDIAAAQKGDQSLELEAQAKVLQGVKAQCADLEKQLLEVRKSSLDVTAENARLRAVELKYSGDLDNSKAEVDRLKTSLVAAQGDAAQHRQAKEAAQSAQRTAEEDAKKLRAKLLETQKGMIEAETMCKEAAGQLTISTQQLNAATNNLQATTHKLEQTQAGLIESERKAAAAIADLNTMSASHQVLLDLQAQHERARKQVHELMARLEEEKARSAAADERVKHADEYIGQLKGDITTLIARNEELLEKYNSMERTLTEKFAVEMRESLEEIWKITQERDRTEEQLQVKRPLPSRDNLFLV